MGQPARQHIDAKYERLNSLYYIIDENTHRVLFQMRDTQEELYHGLHDWNLILKSRQHGITTFFCLFALDTAIHAENVRAGIIAHNQEDAERFFRDKVKYAWENLDPGYKASLGIDATEDAAKTLTFSNNSSIRVGVSLRSATLNVLHISEFGKLCARTPERAREVVAGALNTVHEGALVSIESTAEGRQGYFYDYCQEARKIAAQGKDLTRLDYKFFFFPWWRDPKNILNEKVSIPARLSDYFARLESEIGETLTDEQKNWYSKKEATLGDDMKREHPSTPDEAFWVSMAGTYFKRQFDRIYREKRITPIPYEDGIPVHTAWDLGVGDTTVIWFFQIIGEEYRFIDYYEASGEGLAHYARVIREREAYEYGNHYAPHDIEVRSLSTGETRLNTAKKMGLRFITCDKLFKEDQIEAARALLNKSWFDERKCEPGVSALESYRKEWDEKGGCWRDKPLHDWASHPSDAFMVAAIANAPSPQQQLRMTKPERPREAAY